MRSINILESEIVNVHIREEGAVARISYKGLFFEIPTKWFKETYKHGNYQCVFPFYIRTVDAWYTALNGIDTSCKMSVSSLVALFKENKEKSERDKIQTFIERETFNSLSPGVISCIKMYSDFTNVIRANDFGIKTIKRTSPEFSRYIIYSNKEIPKISQCEKL